MRRELESVYRTHRQGLFTLALSITRGVESAEDAVQTAFQRMFGGTARLPDDPVAYAFAAVRNAALDQVRRSRSREQATGRLAEHASIYNGVAHAGNGAPAASAEAMAAETEVALRRAVDELPDDQREAVVLRIYGQLTFEQMARTLGEPLQTVASRYRRALDALRTKTEGLLL